MICNLVIEIKIEMNDIILAIVIKNIREEKLLMLMKYFNS